MLTCDFKMLIHLLVVTELVEEKQLIRGIKVAKAVVYEATR